MPQPLPIILAKYQHLFHPVVPFNSGTDALLKLNLTDTNPALNANIYNNQTLLTQYINDALSESHARYGIGGYMENRNLYTAHELFTSSVHYRTSLGATGPRTLHLGIDIWGEAGTPVFAPWGGSLHSAAFNNTPGDYGATIVLQHQLDGVIFYTLYGHLSKADLIFSENQYIHLGEEFGHFGKPEENGQWPPHLHFQIIMDMEMKEGDYPGVCRPADRNYYEANCPNPDLILNLMQYT